MLERGQVVQQAVLVEEHVEETLAGDLVCGVYRPFQTNNVTVLEGYEAIE